MTANERNVWVGAVAATALLLNSPAPAYAEDGEPDQSQHSISDAIKSGKPIIDVRYRFEHKGQSGFPQDAYANSIRTRLGYETGDFLNFKVLVEFENVASLGNDHFNSTTNAKTQYPVIADPNATEINRAQVTFTGIAKTPITIGRQTYNLGNQRFVGAVDFRQNQQTFDAARLSSSSIKGLSVDYLYISRVHRIFGDDHPLGEFDSDSHVFAATYDAEKFGKLSGYGIFLDFDEAPALSSKTIGLRYENRFVVDTDAGLSVAFAGEYANQRDNASNPFDYSEHYIHAEGALAARGSTLKLGYEQLSGNGVIGFSTPLATLHKFQGFADVFLSTPANGIEDFYGSLQYDWKQAPFDADLKFFFTYHDFKAETGGADLGAEYDAGLAASFSKYITAELKGAVYNGVAGYADRNLIWASLRFKY
ncbi:MAG: alginate export family protein [Parvularculaceae bacterium]|nr:alginate export family protein [Parvularculaceae bacterium]